MEAGLWISEQKGANCFNAYIQDHNSNWTPANLGEKQWSLHHCKQLCNTNICLWSSWLGFCSDKHLPSHLVGDHRDTHQLWLYLISVSKYIEPTSMQWHCPVPRLPSRAFPPGNTLPLQYISPGVWQGKSVKGCCLPPKRYQSPEISAYI